MNIYFPLGYKSDLLKASVARVVKVWKKVEQ